MHGRGEQDDAGGANQAFEAALAKALAGVHEKAAANARAFAAAITVIEKRPDVWIDDDGIGFEWIFEERHAFASVTADEHIGYTMLENGVFVPGSELSKPHDLPEDLRMYLTSDNPVILD